MTRLLRCCLLALMLCGLASATKYSRGAWSFTLPNEAKETTVSGVRGYQVDGALYIFTPPEPLAGRSLEAVAGSTIADLTQGQNSTVKLVTRDTVDGADVLAYSGTVTDPKSGAGFIHTSFFFGREGQWGMALVITNGDGDPEELLKPLGTVTFRPSTLTASQDPLPKLPPLSWATGRADRVATSAAAVTYPAARKLGLDPSEALLPDTFDCYRVGEAGRAMTPTPDLRVAVSRDGTYTVTDGVTRTPGRWSQSRPPGKGESLRLTLEGPLRASGAYVQGNDDDGQRFTALDPATGGSVLCYQVGPRAEALRLDLTRRRIGGEGLTCQNAGGGSPYALNFGAGTYSTPQGSGRTRLVFQGDDRGDWKGLVQFSGGPLDVTIGEMEEDEDGNRTLEVTETNNISRGIFYQETNTTLVATCRARVTPKPDLLYGRSPAPATGVSGGPDGLFVSFQSRYVLVPNALTGSMLMPSYEFVLSLFRPDGRSLEDLDPTEFGLVPDCGRTKPNGDPFCDRYTLKAGQLSFQDRDDGTWDQAETYRKTANGFTLGKIEYTRVKPISPAELAGVYSTQSFSGSGPAGGLALGGAGIYNSISSGYLFTADGKFQWKYNSSSSTLISPSLITGGGVIGGGGSTRVDGGQGRYTLKDNWLTLTFDDGRVQRLFVYVLPTDDKNDPQRLNLGGGSLYRAPGK